MRKLNCWEIKRCGRQSHGPQAASLGVCPATTDTAANGLNHGHNAGRICWAVAGTLCSGVVQGSFAQKEITCISCEVFKLIDREEGASVALYKPGQIPRRRPKGP